MQGQQFSAPHLLAPEERAFFLRLSAMNMAFDAARAGESARSLAQRAGEIDEMLDRYFRALTSSEAVSPQEHP